MDKLAQLPYMDQVHQFVLAANPDVQAEVLQLEQLQKVLVPLPIDRNRAHDGPGNTRVRPDDLLSQQLALAIPGHRSAGFILANLSGIGRGFGCRLGTDVNQSLHAHGAVGSLHNPAGDSHIGLQHLFKAVGSGLARVMNEDIHTSQCRIEAGRIAVVCFAPFSPGINGAEVRIGTHQSPHLMSRSAQEKDQIASHKAVRSSYSYLHDPSKAY